MLNKIYNKISEIKEYAYDNCVSNFYPINDDDLLDCLKESGLAEKFKGDFNSIPNKFKVTKEEIKNIKDDDHFYRIINAFKYWWVTKTPTEVIDYAVNKLEDAKISLLEELELLNNDQKCIFTENNLKTPILRINHKYEENIYNKLCGKFRSKIAKTDDVDLFKKCLAAKITTHDAITSFVINKAIKCVDYILSQGYDIQKIHSTMIALNDNVEMLKFLIKKGYEFGNDVRFEKNNICAEFAKNCDLKCLKYAHEELGYPVITSKINCLSVSSHFKSEEKEKKLVIETLKYLVKHREDDSQTLMFFIINTDSVSLVNCAIKYGYKIDQDVISRCMAKSDTTIFRYLYENKYFENLESREELIKKAIIFRNHKILEYLWDENYKIDGFSNSIFIDCVTDSQNHFLSYHPFKDIRNKQKEKYDLDKLKCLMFLIGYGLTLKTHHEQLLIFSLKHDLVELFKFTLGNFGKNKITYEEYTVLEKKDPKCFFRAINKAIVLKITTLTKSVTIKSFTDKHSGFTDVLMFLSDGKIAKRENSLKKIDRCDFDKL